MVAARCSLGVTRPHEATNFFRAIGISWSGRSLSRPTGAKSPVQCITKDRVLRISVVNPNGQTTTYKVGRYIFHMDVERVNRIDKPLTIDRSHWDNSPIQRDQAITYLNLAGNRPAFAGDEERVIASRRTMIRASDLNMIELARHTVCIVEHTIGADRFPFPFSEDKLTTFQRLYRNGSVGCLDKGTGDKADGMAFFICFELALSSWSFGFIGPGLRIFF